MKRRRRGLFREMVDDFKRDVARMAVRLEAGDTGRRHPDLPPGFEGFRAWLSKPDPKQLQACRCGWAPALPPHFRVKRAAEDDRRRNSRALRIKSR